MAESGDKSEKKLEEANFEVSSLSEVKDENGNGIFHMRTKTKVIVFISILILLAAGALIYLFVENYMNAEVWQVAVWGLCGVLAIYSIFARSILAMLLNLVLFAGLSFIPIWQSGYRTFQPMIEKFSAEEPAPPVEDVVNEPVTPETPPPISEPKIEEQPKVSEPEKTPAELESKAEEKIPEPEDTSPPQNSSTRENNFRQDLPSI